MAVANVALTAVAVSPANHWTPRSVRHNGIICVCVCCGWQVEVGGGGGALDQVTAAATTTKETADEGAPPQQVNSKCLQ